MFNKTKFDQNVDGYLENLSRNGIANSYILTALEEYKNNWNMDVMDFYGMYNKSIDESTDPYSEPIISAKRVMLKCIEVNEDLVRTMFRDLFSENKDLEGRIGRFSFHMDLLLSELNDKNIPEHYHNKKMILTYLFFKYPDQYCPWDHAKFYKSMIVLGSPNPPSVLELDRYFKILRIMRNFIFQRENTRDIMKIQSIPISSDLILAYDFISYLAVKT